jgi:hypothetical protein
MLNVTLAGALGIPYAVALETAILLVVSVELDAYAEM